MATLALSGGVGGAKLALGLSHVLPPEELVIVANTGDDFDHLGLRICPDLDTVIYTLADLSNKELGWGQQGETWQFLDALARLGGDTWFRLGDRDLATHVYRSQALAEGKPLGQVIREICHSLGILHPVLPMTDDPVPTMVLTRSGERLAFQHYFVRDQCAPEVSGFEFAGIDSARANPDFLAALQSDALEAVIICPSNPFVSVDPILHLPQVMATLQGHVAPLVAVSPIIGGQAIKGPAAKMMRELGMPTSVVSVAKHYVGRIDGLVIDHADAALAGEIEALGMAVCVTKTFMQSLDDRIQLARETHAFARSLSNPH